MRSTTLFLVLAAGWTYAGTLYELQNVRATVYYDLTNDLCENTAAGDPFAVNWGVTSGINGGIPFCEGQGTKSLADLGTNSVVAMNVDMIKGDPAKYCGKEVQILDSSGKTLSISDGPLFIWDACAACATESIVDLSALAFTGLKGGSCAGNNPEGLTVRVLDNNIFEWTGLGSGSQTGGGGGGGHSEPPATSSSAAPSRSSASPSKSTQSSGPIFSHGNHNGVPSPTSSRSPGPSHLSTSSDTSDSSAYLGHEQFALSLAKAGIAVSSARIDRIVVMSASGSRHGGTKPKKVAHVILACQKYTFQLGGGIRYLEALSSVWRFDGGRLAKSSISLVRVSAASLERQCVDEISTPEPSLFLTLEPVQQTWTLRRTNDLSSRPCPIRSVEWGKSGEVD